MPLDARLIRIARGLSARDAVDAFVQSRTDPHSLSDTERQRALELYATIEAMFLMAAVDGQVSEAELNQLAGSVQAIFDMREQELGKRTPPIAIEPVLKELNGLLEREGWKARLDAVAARLVGREARTFAFRLAVGVALVDDHVAHAEAAAIDALAAALHLSADESQEVIHDVQETLFAS